MTEVFSLEETKLLASNLAKNSGQGDCYCLIGDLGAGKTEFARAFIRELCGEITVASPTFNILQIYEASSVGRLASSQTQDANRQTQIYHFDLYRIKSADELVEIGLEEALEKGICLIEWPQVAENLLPEKRTEIRIEILGDDKRKITIT